MHSFFTACSLFVHCISLVGSMCFAVFHALFFVCIACHGLASLFRHVSYAVHNMSQLAIACSSGGGAFRRVVIALSNMCLDSNVDCALLCHVCIACHSLSMVCHCSVIVVMTVHDLSCVLRTLSLLSIALHYS